MSKVVKAVDQYRWGWEQTFPFVGKCTPSEQDGTFVVENDQAAQDLVDLNIGFQIAGQSTAPQASALKQAPAEEPLESSKAEEIQPKSEENELSSNQEEEALEQESPSGEGVELYKESLTSKTRKELEELCKKFPSSEWRGKNKDEIIEYLISKVS